MKSIVTTAFLLITTCLFATPRHLTLVYTCYLTQLPAGSQHATLWIPVPVSDDRQAITLLSVNAPGGKFTTERKYHNRMYYRRFSLKNTTPGDTLKVVLTYRITLSEKTVLPTTLLAYASDEKMQVYLTENELIPLDGAIARLRQQIGLPPQPVAAARKIYDYLIDTMSYNNKAPGSGKGDAVLACSSRTGDCSDYHSVFIGVCRSAGIPADHVFGLPLRTMAGKGEVKKWHCWARFWAGEPGWMTIDASEADKNPELRNYYFGTLSDLYLQLSHGRDVMLKPRQKAPALNLFAEPYAEIDGQPYKAVKWYATFEENILVR